MYLREYLTTADGQMLSAIGIGAYCHGPVLGIIPWPWLNGVL